MSQLRLDRDGPLGVLTIASGPLNLWDAAMESALAGALDELEASPPRGLLVRAEGRVFTGGVDVHEFAGLDRASGRAMSERVLAHAHRVEAFPFPTVLAAHALCLTWGFELAMACDLLVASEDARFGLVETVVGLSPFMGGPQRLALRAGPARAKEFVMTGALYDAPTLADWGVVNRIFPTATFDADSRAFARGLAEGPTLAHAVTKRVVDTAVAGGAGAADALVSDAAGALFDTDDTRSAIASFLERGPGHATYTGT